MVAALFALHPINVESVAWAAERKNVLSTLFRVAPSASQRYARKPELRRYAWVVGLYALALMAKPQVITFPLLLVLWDYWPLGRVAARHDAVSAKNVDFPEMPLRKLLWEKCHAAALGGERNCDHAGAAGRGAVKDPPEFQHAFPAGECSDRVCAFSEDDDLAVEARSTLSAPTNFSCVGQSPRPPRYSL